MVGKANDKHDLAEMLLIPGLVALTILAAKFTEHASKFHSKWTPFIMLGLLTPIAGFYCYKTFLQHPKTRWAAALNYGITLFSISALLHVILKAFKTFGPPHASATMFALGIAYTISLIYILIVRRDPSHSFNPEFPIWDISAAISCLVVWAALFQLPNWVHFNRSCITHPWTTIIIFMACLAITLSVVLKNPGSLLPTEETPEADASRLKKFLWLSAWIGLFLVIVLLSFRFDTLFAGSSEMHWEYYVGPIRGVRNGGWLLWDIPSQYGFLNILTAAILPTKTSWQALYLLQGLLLIPAAAIIYTVITDNTWKRNSIFAALLTISSLFFADPDLIGPYLYPSSSVMRFIWCYLLLFFFFKGRISEKKQLVPYLIKGSLIWAFASMWSIESFIYSTATFFPAIFIAIAQNCPDTRNLPTRAIWVGKLLAIPALILSAIVISISVFYQVKSGHLPDWQVFIEHAISYAGGFGEVKMAPFGSVWILLMLFSAILTLTLRIYIKDFYNPWLIPCVGVLGCLWGVSSYFMGRAVPNNITAIIPLLTLFITISLSAANHTGVGDSSSLLRIVSVPLLTLTLATGLGNIDFRHKISGFKSLASDITTKLWTAPPELQTLLTQIGLRPESAVTYDGGAAAMPRWTYNGIPQTSDRTWLPNPIQLLEVPVSNSRRETYLQRFMTRSKQSGFFIQAKGKDELQTEDRVHDWTTLIQKSHKQAETLDSALWKVTLYTPK